jgi:hypothetical protein
MGLKSNIQRKILLFFVITSVFLTLFHLHSEGTFLENDTCYICHQQSAIASSTTDVHMKHNVVHRAALLDYAEHVTQSEAKSLKEPRAPPIILL